MKPRPAQVHIECARCREAKLPNLFHVGDVVCVVCRRAELRPGLQDRDDPGVTIGLGRGGRVLRVRQLADVIVLTAGYRSRSATPVVTALATVHVPRARIKALQAALARVAAPA